MDTPTHILIGVAAAELGLRSGLIQRLVDPDSLLARRFAGVLVRLTMLFAALWPDLDFMVNWFVDEADKREVYIRWHRSFSHSVVLWPLWSLICAWLPWWLVRRRKLWSERFQPGARIFPLLYGAALLAMGLHLVGDWITSFGTQLLWPLNDTRYALNLIFIIDPPLSLMAISTIVAGVFLSRPAQRRCVAGIVGFGLMGMYLTLLAFSQATAQDRALANLQLPEGEVIQGVVLSPQPLVPTEWLVLVRTTIDQTGDAFTHRALIDSRADAPVLLPWQRLPASLPAHLNRPAPGQDRHIDTYTWFADAPSVEVTERVDGKGWLARWSDQRFVARMPGETDLGEPRFTVLMEAYDAEGKFLHARLMSSGEGDEVWKAAQAAASP